MGSHRRFVEDGDIRRSAPARTVDDSYANGYGNSKWAGEVLLREAHDLCGLPVAVFRADMILAHTTFAGQLNVPDVFTRMMISLLSTGIAPGLVLRPTTTGQRTWHTTTACRWTSSPRRSPPSAAHSTTASGPTT